MNCPINADANYLLSTGYLSNFNKRLTVGDLSAENYITNFTWDTLSFPVSRRQKAKSVNAIKCGTYSMVR